jgi:hypothetical protein
VVCHAFSGGPVAQRQSIKMTRPSERRKKKEKRRRKILQGAAFDVWSLDGEWNIKVIEEEVQGGCEKN